MDVDDAKIAQLAGAEVMTWKVDSLPMAASEVQGPIVVLFEGETIGVYPFYAQPVIDNGKPPSTREHAGDLWIYDPRLKRFIGEHRKNTWNQCEHRPQARSIIVPSQRMLRP